MLEGECAMAASLCLPVREVGLVVGYPLPESCTVGLVTCLSCDFEAVMVSFISLSSCLVPYLSGRAHT